MLNPPAQRGLGYAQVACRLREAASFAGREEEAVIIPTGEWAGAQPGGHDLVHRCRQVIHPTAPQSRATPGSTLNHPSESVEGQIGGQTCGGARQEDLYSCLSHTPLR